jgi:PAS domain S-box-containing protein
VTIDDPGSAMLQVKMTRNAAGVITSVEATMIELLGWQPSQLVGLPSTQFIHPEDQASAISTWMAMITAPGTPRLWRGRYQTAQGAWQWVETVNRLEDADEPVVYSSMTLVTVEQVTIEEELRSNPDAEPADKPVFQDALSAVLADATVDDIEIRLLEPATGAQASVG